MSEKPDVSTIGKATQFTSDNQPSPQAKSEGTKEWWNRRKLAENQLAEFSKPIISKSGVEIQPHEQIMALMKKAFFSPDSKLTEKEKIELYLKLCAQVGIETKDINQTVKADDSTLAGIRELFEAAVAAKSNSTKPDIKLDKASKA